MELEDQNWFPNILRNQQTAFIGFTVSAFKLYKPLLPLMGELLANNKNKQWTDCCSGSAGPVMFFQENTSLACPILLTDKFPNKDLLQVLQKNISYYKHPIDMLKDEIPGIGLVTIFNAFHHFNKVERQFIIEKLIATNRTFLVVEILQPTFYEGIKIFITATIGQLLLAPFVKPFSWLRLFFTYILPVNIITVLWDGLTSVMLAIPYAELQSLGKKYNDPNYKMETGNFKTPLAVITYLTGKPIIEKVAGS